MSNNVYGLRLAVGLLAAATAFACQSLLDTNSLNSVPSDAALTLDMPVSDAPALEGGTLPDLPLTDQGGCVTGSACAVVGQKGLCAVGQAACQESGVGTCKQTVSPTTEKCDGKDSDCDGTADNSDPQAHSSCGSGKYCAGSSCANGCWANSQCTSQGGDTCTSHVCKCGTANACRWTTDTCVTSGTNHVCRCGSSGAACTNGNRCSGGTCRCGTGGLCSPPSTCVNSVCVAPDAGPPPPDQGPPPVDQSVAPDQAVEDAT